jgi:hypothetical protein
MSGMSNACYRVECEKLEQNPKPLLYKKFECKVINKQVEALIFKTMSDSGLGPKYIYQTDEYRIEEFLDARPISIWEMRNPIFLTSIAKAIHDFNFNELAIK